MKKHILIIAFSLLALALFAAAPVVTGNFNGNDVTLVYALPQMGHLQVNYNLVADNACFVSMLVSSDGGLTFDIIPTALTGDIEAGIVPGPGKQILWYPGSESYTVAPHSNYVVKVIADDGNAPPVTSLIFVEGGTFDNGISNITISDFYIDKHEVTQKGYRDVMGSWDSNPTGSQSGTYGIGDDYPAYNVSWFNAIEYCNRRSMQESLTPVYSYDTYGTNPAIWPVGWNTNANHGNISSNWNVNGYRLLTEMEWMYAARGGTLTHSYTYSGTSTESNLVNYAWYTANNTPDGTKEVGNKLPNELGLYDMGGNVWEWVWDRHATAYPTGPQTDPRGVTSGTERVRRGGAYGNTAAHSTVAFRNKNTPEKIWQDMGFRVGRSFLVNP